jgi:hypothetical protein
MDRHSHTMNMNIWREAGQQFELEMESLLEHHILTGLLCALGPRMVAGTETTTTSLPHSKN